MNTRKLRELTSVVLDPSSVQNDEVLYFMHRAVKEDGNLRYDVTTLKPKLLGKEYARTKGNMNKDGFQELYTVLEGQAIFLLQRFSDKKVQDIYAIKMEEGQWIIVPPYYWVIMINPTEDTLETGNWVSSDTENSYRPLEEMGGMAYFYTTEGWIKNNNYHRVPEIRHEKPMQEPESLDFLRTGIEQ